MITPTVMDATRSWLVHLLPKCACAALWRADIPLGHWAPHVLGRVLGTNAKRIKR